MEFIPTKFDYLPHPAEPENIETPKEPSYFERQVLDWIIRHIFKKGYWRKYAQSRLLHVTGA